MEASPPNVFSVNALELSDYTSDKQAALRDVEPRLARKLEAIRGEMMVSSEPNV